MFYDNLKKECELQNLKITPIVLECGGNKGSLSGWKKGASPNSDIVAKLAKRLNVSTDLLILGEENQTPPSASSAKYVDIATYNANVNKATGDNISQNTNMTLSSQNSISNDIAIELDTLINELEDEKIKQLLIAQVSSSIENFRPFSSKKNKVDIRRSRRDLRSERI